MNLDDLISETRNPATLALDEMSTLEMMACFNHEDSKVPLAVQQVLPEIAQVVELAAVALQSGGRLIYIGAGTSGRLGVLDASECPPTFGVSPDRVVGLIAGGPDALLNAVEGAEDSMTQGEADLQAQQLTSRDLVIGLAASGRTPYVIGALRYARERGCPTAAISCNPDSPLTREALVAITPVVGPEALTGSTRLKSGTAQKLVLNMISTGAMVRLGKVYQNLMVDLKATNEKLVARACRMVMEATGVEQYAAEQALRQCAAEVKPAILMLLKQVSAEDAQRLLQQHHGYLRAALQG